MHIHHRFGVHVQAVQQGSQWAENHVWVYELIPPGARQSPRVRGGRGKKPCRLHPGKSLSGDRAAPDYSNVEYISNERVWKRYQCYYLTLLASFLLDQHTLTHHWIPSLDHNSPEQVPSREHQTWWSVASTTQRGCIIASKMAFHVTRAKLFCFCFFKPWLWSSQTFHSCLSCC